MTPEDYREQAARCVEVAEQLKDGKLKTDMLAMALVWLQLAEHTEERDRRVVGPPGSARHHVSQQQHQPQVPASQHEPESDTEA